MASITALKTFLSIVDNGSLAKSAETLNVTQSTVTARLQALEASVGVQLLTRDRSGVQLTERGAQMHRYASAMVNLWRQANQEVAPSQDTVLTIAISLTLQDGVGSTLINKLLDAPSVGLMAHRCSDEAALAGLLNRKQIDACLSMQPISGTGIDTYPWRDQIVCLFGSDPGRPIDADPRYVYVDYGFHYGLEHSLAYSDAGTAKVRTQSPSAAVQILQNRGGSAYLPKEFLAHADALQLFPLAGAPEFHIPTYLSCHQASGWRRGLVV